MKWNTQGFLNRLEATKGVLSDKSKVTQFALAVNNNNEVVSPFDETAVQFCLWGAYLKANFRDDEDVQINADIIGFDMDKLSMYAETIYAAKIRPTADYVGIPAIIRASDLLGYDEVIKFINRVMEVEAGIQ